MDKALATASISIISSNTGKANSDVDDITPVSSFASTSTMASAISASSSISSTSSIPSSRPEEKVRVLDISEYKPAALSLAEAFREDHTTEYFVNCPDTVHWTAEEKWDLHLSMMEYIVYAHCLNGLVTTVGPDYGAIALWMPPGKNMDDLYTIFRSGMWRLNYKLSAEAKIRFFNEFLPLLGSTKTSVLGARDLDSWYLVYIGCLPSARGKGYARKLIDHVTDQADEEMRCCYLESSAEVNLKIYGRMGFEAKRKVYLQRAEEIVELDIMVREPVVGKRDSFMETGSEMRKERVLA